MMVVDASVWAGFFIAGDAHHEVSRRWLKQQYVEHRRLIVCPSLLLAEVGGAVARRTADADLASALVEELTQLPELELVPLDNELSLAAGRLAASLRLRGADACYVAVAQVLGLPLVTWDTELQQRAGQVVSVLEPK
ncbi:MAG: type II toxin-antitoxin system VapC family toxin [Anaerolineae bacterium]